MLERKGKRSCRLYRERVPPEALKERNRHLKVRKFTLKSQGSQGCVLPRYIVSS